MRLDFSLVCERINSMDPNSITDSIRWLQSSQLVYNIQQRFKLQRLKDDKIVIGNYFWYYTFLFGTILGDELFYSIFIPFWFWNIDSVVGRRMVFIWAVTMYIGQTLKDVIQMPRPDFPAIKLKDRWCMEYGMPSTHAMTSITLPLSIFYFSSEYNIPAAVLLTIIWSSLLLIVITVGIIICYPHSGKWTPTRSDTTTILAVFNGVYIGGCFIKKLNICIKSQIIPFTIFGITCKTIIGLVGMLLLKSYLKTKIFRILCQISGHDPLKIQQAANSLDNTIKIYIELTCIYITYTCLGLYIHFGNCLLF